MFQNREDAGKKLAELLTRFKSEKPIILAIPRGGVVVGAEVARSLSVPLEIIIPRKIPAPNQPELAIGAVAEDGSRIIDQGLIKILNIPEIYIDKETKNQIKEIKRRLKEYRNTAKTLDIKNKTVILIDDGLATGSTMLAAINFIKKKNPGKIILAIPVAPADTYQRMKSEVDKIVCLDTPVFFSAVGQFYQDFRQINDKEVISLLKELK